MKINIFKKTVLTSFISSLATLIAFTFILQASTRIILNKYSKSQLEHAGNDIVNIDKLSNLTVKNLTDIENKYQVSIMIRLDDGTIIYPAIYTFNDDISSSALSLFPSQSTNANTHISKYHMIESINFEILIVQNSLLNQSEVRALYSTMVPYLLLISVFMSLIIAYFYSKFTLKKINSMNNNMAQMETLTYNNTFTDEVDELDVLNTSIHNLYYKLVSEIETIKNMEADRHMFMRGTIHELKTPIMLMDININQMLDDLAEDSTQYQTLLNIQSNLSSMRHLVNSGLEISNVDDEMIETSVLIDEVITYYEPMIEDKNLIVKKDLHPFSIEMNADLYKKVISNILSNAIKYASESSTIIIQQSNDSLSITNTYTDEIDVTKDLTKAFTRGNNESTDSHGLGLYVVSNILKKYKINYEYNVMNNTFVFIIYY